MLPFDNKSEFEVIVNMPEGTSLEQTAHVTREIGQYLATVPEVTDYEMYVGTAAPYNFNGLVRHYFLRQNPYQADLQVNLLPKGERTTQSHDIAKRVRPGLDAIAATYGARVQVAEVPPGPPVLQTLVAEVYGPEYADQVALARDDQGALRRDARRRGRGLVRRGAAPAGPLPRGSREGGPERGHARGGGPHAPVGGRAAWRSGCSTSPMRRRT